MTWRRISAIVVTILVLAEVAWADHIEPAKANKISFGLVNGFIHCDSPNTATESGLDACAPALPADARCFLTPSGVGKISFSKVGDPTLGTQDIKVIVAAQGLNPACEDEQLHVRISFRITTDDCPEGSCTTFDYTEFNLSNASCFVNGGKCKIKTTLNAAAPGLMATNGKNAGFQILGCGLHGSAFAPSPSGLACGMLLK